MKPRKKVKEIIFGENADLKDIASQLRKPKGEVGAQIGLKMNEGNRDISLNSYLELLPDDSETILEIGMGNGFFIKDLLHQNKIIYIGLDHSSVMVDAARQMNRKFIEEGRVRILEGSVSKIPLADDSVDAIVSTNTIYFWPDIAKDLSELLRVLKPGGRLLLAYRSKAIMDQMEVTKFQFDKYESLEIETLLANCGFAEISTKVIKESDINMNGKIIPLEGLYTLAYKRLTS